MTSSELALRTSTDVPALFREQRDMAKDIALSSLLPRHLQGKPENLLVILAGARSLDISWFWACQSLYVVEGRLSYSAELMRGLVIRAGHKFRVIENGTDKAVVEIVRSDDPEFPARFEFTKDDARTAGLLDRSTWKKFPKSMMLARATSMAVRSSCPDVLFGCVYTPEELGAAVDESGEALYDDKGRVVIDATLAEDVVNQETIDRAGNELVNVPDLTVAAATYGVVLNSRWTHLIPNLDGVEKNEKTLYDLWIDRLNGAIANTADPLSEAPMDEREDHLRRVWHATNTTKLMNVVASNGMSFNDAILTAKKQIDDLRADEAKKKDETDSDTPLSPTEIIERLGGGEKIGESS